MRKVTPAHDFTVLATQPSASPIRLICVVMGDIYGNRRLLPLALGALLACPPLLAQSGQKASSQQNSPPQQQNPPAQPSYSNVPDHKGAPMSLKPDLPGMQRNHRLILKDGSYQLVRQYKIVGDRIRYLSVERGDWEEMPVSMVDWDATRKWEQEHTPAWDQDNSSPAMQEAAQIDKQEKAARDEIKARTPLVAPGLELPDDVGVFALDTFHGTPELIRLTETDILIYKKQRHGLGILNPRAGQNAEVSLDGRHSRIHLHVSDPAIYLSLANPDDNAPITGHAFTVNTNAARAVNGYHGAASAQSRFAIVRVDERNAVRIVHAVRLNPDGSAAQNENVIPVKSEVLTGRHWIRIQAAQPLNIGEYALIEILGPSNISPTVWDFRVDPTKGDNPGSITPVEASAATAP